MNGARALLLLATSCTVVGCSTGYSREAARDDASDVDASAMESSVSPVPAPRVDELPKPETPSLPKGAATNPEAMCPPCYFWNSVTLSCEFLCNPGDNCCSGKCTTLECNKSTCFVDSNCYSNHCSAGDKVCCSVVCDGNCGSGTCLHPNGDACTGDTQCISGHCTDGHCCGSANCGLCGICTTGSCLPLAKGTTPTAGSCDPAGTAACAQHVCDGTQMAVCGQFVGTSTSCGAAYCTKTGGNWSYQPSGTCTGTGACSTPPANCGLYACGATGCLTKCTSNADCADGVTCNASGVCVSGGKQGSPCNAANPCSTGLYCVDGYCCGTASCPTGSTCGGPATTALGTCHEALGSTCATNDECGSGMCVDGHCCNSPCTGQCQACNVAGKLGTCSNVSGTPVGTRAKCSTVFTDATCAARCDGFTPDKCTYPTASVACGKASCTAGEATHLSSCDGAGNCGDVPTSCGHYVCGATTCLTNCTSAADCASGYTCNSKHECVELVGLGAPCDPTGASTCASMTYCVATSTGSSTGYCCDKSPTDCDPAKGFSCALVGHEGHCLKKQGATCAADLECGSGFCIDGTCCDSKCDGQCEACDVLDSSGNKGKCTPVAGKPHGSKPACDMPAGAPCKAAACDGKDTTACKAFVGSETTCQVAACADGKFSPAATCDGAGNCATSGDIDCNGFTCTADGKACKSTCTDGTDCLTGFSCDPGSHKCVRINSHCEGDTAVANDTGAKQDCAPYHCLPSGACGSSCSASTDCQDGNVCDTASSQCVAAPNGDAGSGGGCSASRGTSAGSGLGIALVALAIASRRRRA